MDRGDWSDRVSGASHIFLRRDGHRRFISDSARATIRSEQAGDGQARSRCELIDFLDSNLYSLIEVALPDRAAMPQTLALKMNVEHRIQCAREAKIRPPIWTGDLDDDCISEWAGVRMRAEWMEGKNWWWSVTEIATEMEIDSSHNHDPKPMSGEVARRSAEHAACDWFNIPTSFSNCG